MNKEMNKPREEEKEIRANMKQVDENIYDILVEFMATRPDRDYSLEAHSTKEEIAEGREKNIEHIKNFIPSIKDLISQACSSQLKEVLGVIESKRADEMSASEGIKTVALSDNLWHRLYNSNKKEWVAAEIYNQALDDLKAEVEKLV